MARTSVSEKRMALPWLEARKMYLSPRVRPRPDQLVALVEGNRD
jgi:predicted dithiol-disulfide oxidoreductase (DUF899 family)